MHRGAALWRLEIGDRGLDQLIGIGIGLRRRQGRTAGNGLFQHAPQPARLGGGHRHAGDRDALQDLGPFLRREACFVRHAGLLN